MRKPRVEEHDANLSVSVVMADLTKLWEFSIFIMSIVIRK
jgi:hypothetical protein